MSRTRILLFALLMAGCSAEPSPGPDKQFGEGLRGALTGAGAGAVTGFQLGSGTGPGALAGAGFGAVAGGIRGAAHDQVEESFLKLKNETRTERQTALVNEILRDHYQKQLELHPTREIYPADLFFFGDESRLRPESLPLVRAIARMNKQRLPYSRIAITSYARANGADSTFAQHLAEKRARELSDYFIASGMEPRRIVARPVVVSAPVLIDPHDDPLRYNQAIELIPLDR